MDTKGGKLGGEELGLGLDIYTLMFIKQVTNKNLLYKK